MWVFKDAIFIFRTSLSIYINKYIYLHLPNTPRYKLFLFFFLFAGTLSWEQRSPRWAARCLEPHLSRHGRSFQQPESRRHSSKIPLCPWRLLTREEQRRRRRRRRRRRNRNRRRRRYHKSRIWSSCSSDRGGASKWYHSDWDLRGTPTRHSCSQREHDYGFASCMSPTYALPPSSSPIKQFSFRWCSLLISPLSLLFHFSCLFFLFQYLNFSSPSLPF